MGTPALVVPVMQAVERAGVQVGGEVVTVYTSPDRAAGRGRRMQPSPMRLYAESRGLEVLTPARVTTAGEQERFEALGADLVVLAAYGLLLPKPFLFGPVHGALNVHPSLLPRHRGAAPVAGAILAGDERTGTTLIRMDEGLDTGPIVAQEEIALEGTERSPALTGRLFGLGAQMLEECLPAYVRGKVEPWPQREDGATTIKRFAKDDSLLDWTRPAVELERRVRALDPWPGTTTTWEGKRLDVLETALGKAASGGQHPGQVVQVGADVGVVTGDGVLVLEQVRLEGRKASTGAEFLRGHASFEDAQLPS